MKTVFQGEWFQGSDGQMRRVFRVDVNDTSRLHSQLRDGGNCERCSCCWGGCSHSIDLHNQKVSQ